MSEEEELYYILIENGINEEDAAKIIKEFFKQEKEEE